MSTTLPFGRKLPTDGDRGSSWFDDLETNIALNDAHTHDGVTSPLLPSKNISKPTTTLLAASWSAVAGENGTYKQTVSTPSGVTVAAMIVKFAVNSAGGEFGNQLFLTVRRVTDLTYDVFINDNSLEVLATYG